MWEMASLFEKSATVRTHHDAARSPTVQDRPDGSRCASRAATYLSKRFTCRLMRATNPARSVIDNINLPIRPGEKIGLVGRSGAGKAPSSNLLLRFYGTYRRDAC